jgi:hypothetical protein
MKYSVGQKVKVSLPHCKIDGEVHAISQADEHEFLQYEITVGNAKYRFIEHELTLVNLVYAVFHQYRPSYKYPPSIKSLWSQRSFAEKAAQLLIDTDSDCWIEELTIDLGDEVYF